MFKRAFWLVFILSGLAFGQSETFYLATMKVKSVTDSSIVKYQNMPNKKWQTLVDLGAKYKTDFEANVDTTVYFLDWKF